MSLLKEDLSITSLKVHVILHSKLQIKEMINFVNHMTHTVEDKQTIFCLKFHTHSIHSLTLRYLDQILAQRNRIFSHWQNQALINRRKEHIALGLWIRILKLLVQWMIWISCNNLVNSTFKHFKILYTIYTNSWKNL